MAPMLAMATIAASIINERKKEMGKKKKNKNTFVEWLDPFQTTERKERDNTQFIEYVKKTVENTVVARLDGIVSKEQVMLDDSKEPVTTAMLLTNEADALNILKQHSNDESEEYTIVYVCNKKHIDDVFNIVDGIRGTLGFNEIFLNSDIVRKHNSLNLGADGTVSTAVIYIPGLIVNRGKIPFHYNILIVVEPTYKELATMYEEAADDVDKFDIDNLIITQIISDVFSSCIKLGCKDIILNPYGYKPLQRADYDWTGALWKRAIKSNKVKNNFYSITLCTTSDNQYVGFASSKITPEVYDAINRVTEIQSEEAHEAEDEKADQADDVKKRRRMKIEID